MYVIHESYQDRASATGPEPCECLTNHRIKRATATSYHQPLPSSSSGPAISRQRIQEGYVARSFEKLFLGSQLSILS
jgi:hypothetical protein